MYLHVIPLKKKTPNKPLNKICTQTSEACFKSMAPSPSSEQFLDGIQASFSSAFCSPRASNEHTQDLTVSFPKRSNLKIKKFYRSQKQTTPTQAFFFLSKKPQVAFLTILLFFQVKRSVCYV